MAERKAQLIGELKLILPSVVIPLDSATETNIYLYQVIQIGEEVRTKEVFPKICQSRTSTHSRSQHREMSKSLTISIRELRQSSTLFELTKRELSDLIAAIRVDHNVPSRYNVLRQPG